MYAYLTFKNKLRTSTEYEDSAGIKSKKADLNSVYLLKSILYYIFVLRFEIISGRLKSSQNIKKINILLSST